MKSYTLLAPLLCLLTLFGCSGSDTYRGKWKATDNGGNRFELTFEPKRFSITDTRGKTASFEYTQNSVSIRNSTRTYGIQLRDGRAFNIVFPIAHNTDEGMLTGPGNEPVYTISRTAYIRYQDLYKLMQ